jgi:hypothetical protein
LIAFGSAIAEAATAAEGARRATAEAILHLHAQPALAIVFASPDYADLAEVPAAVGAALGGIPVIGGTSGGSIIGPEGVATHGVSVVVLGGDLEVAAVSAPIASPDLVEIVPPAKALGRSADRAGERGLSELTCLAFGPGIYCDGEAMVAAIRKGVGPRAQLAGALTGDDLTFDRTRVFADGGVHGDRIALAGVFTRVPLGIAARHGYRPVGHVRTVTRAEGPWLVALDGRPAFDAWADDVRAAGGHLPNGRGKDVTAYLANHFELGVGDFGRRRGQDTDAGLVEPVVRAPFAIREDGAVRMSASLAEGARTRVMHATRDDLLQASRQAAELASSRAGKRLSGALVLACTGRLAALGNDFAREPASIARLLHAPIGGACVFGEIARSRRDADAFHNTTTVVVAVPSAA